MVEKWFSPKEVAEQTGFDVETLRFWRAEGKGPRFYVVGRRIRYGEGDLEAWRKSLDGTANEKN